MIPAKTNPLLVSSLRNAPAAIQRKLPKANEVIGTLQSGHSSTRVQLFLRQTFHSATHYVYLGLLITAVVTLIFILLTPAKFPVLEDEE